MKQKNQTPYGVCALSRIPIRNEPSHTAEQVTELLFGESYSILEIKGDWYEIICTHPSYRGWIHIKQITFIDEQEWQRLLNPTFFCAENCTLVALGVPHFDILKGSPLPFEKISHTITLNGQTYTVNGKVVESKKEIDVLLHYAKGYINAPYMWGGRSPYGIDCSGLMQILFQFVGIKLTRDVSTQITEGVEISFNNIKPGDLMFFKNTTGTPVHVGLVISPQEVIHASGYVKLSKFDERGIREDDNTGYSHTYHKIRRVFQ